MKYFVYFLLDPRKPGCYQYDDIELNHEPFYVGVSYRTKRLDEHLQIKNNHKNKFKNNIIAKLKKLNFSKEQIGFIFKKNLTKKQAFELEGKIIKQIGRRDLKTGTLTNLDFGGIGGDGEHWKNKKHSEKTKQKIRNTIGDSRKGTLNSNFGKKWTSIQKQQASTKQTENHKHLCGENNPSKSKAVRAKLSESKLGLKNPNASSWKLISPTGEEFMINGGIKVSLKQHGIDYQTFKKDFDKIIRKNFQGWTLIKIK